MVDIFKIEGLEKLVQGLDKAASDFEPTMKKGMGKAITHVHDQIPAYPAAPSGSTYVRTLELGRKLFSKVDNIGGDIAGVIGDPIVYAPWVISKVPVGTRGPQAAVHQGRWWTLQDEVDDSMPQVLKILGETVASLLP